MLLFIWLKEIRLCACNSARPLYLEPNMKGCVFYVLHGFALKLGETSQINMKSVFCYSTLKTSENRANLT
jgi:hypothetical protein